MEDLQRALASARVRGNGQLLSLDAISAVDNALAQDRLGEVRVQAQRTNEPVDTVDVWRKVIFGVEIQSQLRKPSSNSTPPARAPLHHLRHSAPTGSAILVTARSRMGWRTIRIRSK